MTDYFPHSFFEAAGGIAGLVALIFAFISLSERYRTHSLRVLSVFFVVSISLFSNHAGVYFAAVFIIATAVTELEFLQTLAAIIRGNKEYFDYKMGTLTSDEKLRAIRAELHEMGVGPKKDKPAANDGGSAAVNAESKDLNDESAVVVADSAAVEASLYVVPSSSRLSNEIGGGDSSVVSNETVRGSHLDSNSPGYQFPPGLTVHRRPDKGYLRTIVELEGKALDWVEELFGSRVHRNVLIKSGALELDLDGVVRNTSKSGRPDEIFEVKFVSSESSFDILLKLIPRIQNKTEIYASVTSRPAVCQLILVLDDEVVLTESQYDELSDVVYKNGLQGFHVLRSNELHG